MVERPKKPTSYDVIIVGAGPGGTSAAQKCAENNLKVALLEKHSQPGMKTCAGGVDNRIIKEFNIDDDVIQYYTKNTFLMHQVKDDT